MLKLKVYNQFVEQNSTLKGSIHHRIQIKFCVKLFQLFSDIHLVFVGHLEFLGRVPTSCDEMYINIGSKTCLLAFSNKVIDKQQLRFDKLWFGSEPGCGPLSGLGWWVLSRERGEEGAGIGIFSCLHKDAFPSFKF